MQTNAQLGGAPQPTDPATPQPGTTTSSASAPARRPSAQPEGTGMAQSASLEAVSLVSDFLDAQASRAHERLVALAVAHGGPGTGQHLDEPIRAQRAEQVQPVSAGGPNGHPADRSADAAGGADVGDVAAVGADAGDEARRADPPAGVLGVAVTLAVAGSPSTIGSSTPAARQIDEVQFDIGVGPCLHALRTGEGDYVPDLARDDRWGTYGPEAARLGAACCLSLPIVSDGQPTAVVKVYSTRVDGLSAEQRELTRTLAHEVAGSIGLAHALTSAATELDDRVEVMNRRRAIDLAIGILMERDQISADAAFHSLREQSQRYNVKVHDVARGIVYAVAPDATASIDEAPFVSRQQP